MKYSGYTLCVKRPNRADESDMNAFERLNLLCHHRWTVPVLAELHRGRGARLVVLLNRLGASQGALRSALDYLIDLGWIRRNPGSGHPLRPEYILGAGGKALGEVSLRLMSALDAGDLRHVGLLKWSMPILFAIGSGAARFAEIRRHYEGLTDRALSLALRDLTGAGLIIREIVDGAPPVTRYAPTEAGRALSQVLEEF